MNHLFINENLTQRRKQLSWLAKQKVKEDKLRARMDKRWSNFCKKIENHDKIIVKTENDFNKL